MSDRLNDILGRIEAPKTEEKPPTPGETPPAVGADGKPLKPLLTHSDQWNTMEATYKKKS